MRYFRIVSAAAMLAAFLADGGPAHAANPPTAACLEAAEKSLQLADEHKLRAARATLFTCAQDVCPADVRNECKRRIAEVNAAVPTLVFLARDATGAQLTQVRITMEGETLAERLDDASIPVDPGERVFDLESPGLAPVRTTLFVREGQKSRVVSVVFEPNPATPLASPGPAAPRTSPSSAPQEQSSRPLTPRTAATIAALSLGAIGVVVGAAYGVDAASRRSDAERTCPAPQCPTPAGVTAWSGAKSSATVSTVAFVLAGVGVAGGAILWLSTRPKPGGEGGVLLGIGPTGVVAQGVW